MDTQLQARADQDEQDIRESVGGNQTSFARLISRYFGISFAAAFPIVGQRETAEEVVQEAFLKVWLNLATLKRQKSFPAWVMEISRNTARDWARKGQRRSKILPLISLEDVSRETADIELESVLETSERVQEQKIVRKAILALPPDLQELILLHYSEDLSKSEIARVMGVHPSTVARQLDRAHGELRRGLEPILKEAAHGLKPGVAASKKTMAVLAGLTLLPAAQQLAVAVAVAGSSAGVAGAAVAPVIAASATTTIKTGGGAGFFLKAMVFAVTVAVAGIGLYSVKHFTQENLQNSDPKHGAGIEMSQVMAPSISSNAPQRAGQSPAGNSRGSVGGGTALTSPARTSRVPRRQPAAYGPLPPANMLTEVSGKVLDAQRRPVSGATVVAASKHGAASGHGGAKPTAVTAQDGAFRLTNVAPGGLGLYVTTADHAAVINEVTAPSSGATVILGGGGARLSGQVVHADTGKPIAHTTISLSLTESNFNTYGDIPKPSAVSGADGSFALDHLVPGEYILYAEAEGMGLLAERPGLLSFSKGDVKLYNLDEGDSVDDAKVRLYDGHTITGTVRDATTGKPLPGVTLISIESFYGATKQAATTGADGKYRMKHVTGKGGLRVWFKLKKSGYTHKAEKQWGDDNSLMFDLPGGRTLVRDFELTPAIAVSGIVKDEEGRPMEDAMIVVNADCTADQIILDPTDAGGRYEAALPANCNALLMVHKKDTPVAWQAFETKGSAVVQDIVMISGATAGGVVIDTNGLPVAGAAVEATIPSVSYGNQTMHLNQQLGQTRTDANGRFAIANLPRADITLVAKKAGYAEAPLPMQITESGTKDEAVIELTGGKDIRGIVTNAAGEPVGDIEIRLWDKVTVDKNLYTKSGADGSFAFTSLPDRAMVLIAEHPELGKASKETAPGGEVVTLALGGPGSSRPLKVSLIDWKTGAAVSDFKIVSFAGMGPQKSPEPGVFVQQDVKPGSSVSYKIKAPGYANLDTGNVDAPDAESTGGLIFQMGPGGTVEGRLKRPGDTTASLANIKILIPGGTGKPADDLQAVTDASGAFRLEHVPEGKTKIRIQPPPPDAEITRDIEVAHGSTVWLGELELVEGSRVAGQITLGATHKPLAGVEVEIGVFNEEAQKTRTDASGHYEFSGLGHLSYFVSVPAYNLQVHVQPDEGSGAVETIDFNLGAATVKGQALQAGAPVSGVHINFHNGDVGWQTQSSNGGRFTLTGLAAGEYTVTADGAGHSGRSVVHIADGETTDIVVHLDSGSLSGRAVDADGEPLPGVYVTAVWQSNVEKLRTSLSTITSDDGTFSMESRPAGRYAVAAILNKQIITPVYFADVPAGGAAPHLDVKVTTESAIVVSITRGADGSPRQDAEFFILPTALGVYHKHNQQRDANGRVGIRDLPPGSYKITITAPGAQNITRVVELSNGETATFEDVIK